MQQAASCGSLHALIHTEKDTHHMMACDTSQRNKRHFLYFILCVIYFCLLCCLIDHWNGSETWLQTWTNKGTSVSASKSRSLSILLWHWPYGKAYPLNGDVCLDLFKIPGCEVLNQRSEFSKVDVVVFHQRELATKKEKLPLNLERPQRQRWVWLSLEAPENNGNLQPFANLFNLTMSYRRDADITVPYGELQPHEDGDVEVLPMNKTDLVCWVVSNFNRRHKRSLAYSQLSAFVNITVYGHWKKATLSAADLLPTISHCYFYLAFENSLSKDYITEKLWRNAYQSGAVPIVLGPTPADYRAVAPPNSFIHFDDFSSAKKLVTYMQELAADKERYEDYFRWRQEWRVKLYVDWRERLCKICTQSLPQWKVYSDLHKWNHV